MKGFASATRLELLNYIQQGIGNPGEITRKMNRHRSTIESHLQVLVEADAVKIVP
ncbi:MAG: ArsR family transcriptional regulator [Candidatus Heimdallarchaeota archaeon]